MNISGAQAVVQALIKEGVDTLFGYPGGTIMPTYDALYHARDRIRHILVRHEQGATHAAEGYARTTGKVGVCIATSGPGATNLITGMADALMDSTPLVCITGQVVSGLLGSDAFQESDVIGMTLAASKWNYQITDPAEIPSVFAKAFKIARSGRPGPVLIDITKDAQLKNFDPTEIKSIALPEWRYPHKHRDLSALDQAASLINQAKRPYLLVGQGVQLARAEKSLITLAERAGIPMACTLLGLSAIPNDHPLYVGMLGMHGNYGANLLTNHADVIIAVGMRFDDRVTGCVDTYAKQAKIIHIEIDPAEVNKTVNTDIALIDDANVALEALLPLVKPAEHSTWLAQFREHDAEEYQQVIKSELRPEIGSLRMGEIIDAISRQTQGNAVIVSDVGQHQMMAARYYRFKKPLSHITSGGLGTMGFALPAAIGAKLGAPERDVIAIIGDGSFQMTLQELGTVMQENIALKLVILNNGYLGMVRQWQELFFDKRYSFVNMTNPDFTAICKGYGIAAAKISARSELEQGLNTMLNSAGSYLLDVQVGQECNVFPMIEAGAGISEMRLK